MKMIEDKTALNLLKSFSNNYFKRGLGGYSGRELEILVLDLLLELHPEFKTMSLFEKSRLLMASETKIKNSLYQVKLRKADSHQELLNCLQENLNSIELEKGKVIIEIDDLFAKKQLKALLKKMAI